MYSMRANPPDAKRALDAGVSPFIITAEQLLEAGANRQAGMPATLSLFPSPLERQPILTQMNCTTLVVLWFRFSLRTSAKNSVLPRRFHLIRLRINRGGNTEVS